MSSIHSFLARLIDYAGLFPPAELDMKSAVRNYARYLKGEYAWVLGRFIVPVARLDEFSGAAREFASGTTWKLSVLVGANLESDFRTILEFNRRNEAEGTNFLIDAVEMKAADKGTIAQAPAIFPSGFEVFVELPLGNELEELIAETSRHGFRAKIRTGGVTPGAFPSTAEVLRFLEACAANDAPFKATAGLHHPIRAEYRLTYAENSPCAPMHGFFNIFLAAAFLRSGVSSADVLGMLNDSDIRNFRFEEDGVRWRDHRIDSDTLATIRDRFALSFGSCSFEEPIEETMNDER